MATVSSPLTTITHVCEIDIASRVQLVSLLTIKLTHFVLCAVLDLRNNPGGVFEEAVAMAVSPT